MSNDASEAWADFDGINSDFSLRLPSLPHRPPMVEKILSEAILDHRVASCRRQAQYTFFCGAEPEQLGGYDGQLEVVGRCLEWFVFDCVIPELEATPAQHWFSCCAGTLSEQDRVAAKNCLDFILGIFEIVQVVPGEGFTVLDLLRVGRRYHITERIVSKEILPGQLLLSRIFPDNDTYNLSGMAVLMDENATAEIKQLISDGRLKSEFVLPSLDGLELENLFGRSLAGIEHDLAPTTLQRYLRRYVEDVNPNHLSYSQLLDMIKHCDDVVELITMIDGQFKPFCHHESDLIVRLVLTIWNQSHQS